MERYRILLVPTFGGFRLRNPITGFYGFRKVVVCLAQFFAIEI